MERLAERNFDGARAIPAQFDDGRLFAREVERGREATSARARMDHDVAFVRRRRRQCEIDTERRRDLGALRPHIDQRDLGARQLGGEIGAERADHAGADHRDAVGRAGRRIPDGIERGFHVGGEHAARSRNVRRQYRDPVRRHGESGLVGMKHEGLAAAQVARAVNDVADDRVAVLHRERELADHERGAHAAMFAWGHASGENEALGAAADPAVERANLHLAGTGRTDRLGPDLRLVRTHVPQGLGGPRFCLIPQPILASNLKFPKLDCVSRGSILTLAFAF